MSLRYHDHLHDGCTQVNLAAEALTAPRSIGTPVDLTFSFLISFNSSQLDKQATAWMNSVRGNSKISSAIDKFISISFEDRDAAIRDAYKYSFFKTFSAMQDLVINGFNYFGAVPSNSLVFYGHKMLFYTFMNYNIFSPSLDLTSNVYLRRTVNLDEDVLSEIEKDPVWISSFNETYPGGVFNPTFERILQALQEIEEIHVSTLSHQNDIPADSTAYSLGSMAYTSKAKPNFFSSMEESIATVSNYNSLTDHISKFWNVANFVNVIEIPERFNVPDSGSPYIYVRTRNVDDATIFAQVESITGLNNNGMYSRYGINIPGVGNSPLNPGTPPNNNNPLGGSGGNNNNPINPSGGNGKNPLEIGPNSGSYVPKSNRKQNGRIKTFVKHKAELLGRALSSKEVREAIVDAGLTLFNAKLTERRQNDLIKSLRQTGIVSEHDGFKTKTPWLDFERGRGKTLLIENKKED